MSLQHLDTSIAGIVSPDLGYLSCMALSRDALAAAPARQVCGNSITMTLGPCALQPSSRLDVLLGFGRALVLALAGFCVLSAEYRVLRSEYRPLPLVLIKLISPFSVSVCAAPSAPTAPARPWLAYEYRLKLFPQLCALRSPSLGLELIPPRDAFAGSQAFTQHSTSSGQHSSYSIQAAITTRAAGLPGLSCRIWLPRTTRRTPSLCSPRCDARPSVFPCLCVSICPSARAHTWT